MNTELLERGYVFVHLKGLPVLAFDCDLFTDGVGGIAFPATETDEWERDAICSAMKLTGDYTVIRDVDVFGSIVTCLPHHWNRDAVLVSLMEAVQMIEKMQGGYNA